MIVTDFPCTIFIGSNLYREIQNLHMNIERMNREIFDDYRMQGWLADFNVRHNYTQLWYLEPFQNIVRLFLFSHS